MALWDGVLRVQSANGSLTFELLGVKRNSVRTWTSPEQASECKRTPSNQLSNTLPVGREFELLQSM